MVRVSSSAMLYIGLTIAFTVIGQLLVKRGMLQVGSSPTDASALPRFVLATLTNPSVVVGLASAVVAAIAWTMALSRSDLNFAYPFMALAIVLVLAMSGLLFGESVVAGRWVGVGIVCLGLVVAASAH